MRWVPTFFLVLAAGCSPGPPDALPEDRMPREALQTFEGFISEIGGGALRCSPRSIRDAAYIRADINRDGAPDFAIDTRQLSCVARNGEVAAAYFCGTYTCAYPLLVSGEEGWRVVPMMSGNEIEVVTRFYDEILRVRQINFGDPSRSTITVRDYAWEEGELRRVAERAEAPGRR